MLEKIMKLFNWKGEKELGLKVHNQKKVIIDNTNHTKGN